METHRSAAVWWALGIATPLALIAAPDNRPFPPLPTASQAAWQAMETNAFVHFGPNTFTNVEWGSGREDPSLFNPTAFDARQWVRVFKQAGFRGVIITAKHHDGFCLWPSALSTHTVSRSPWRGGKGDVLRELSDACREEGLKFGVYLSPWDRNHPAYGTAEYNRVFAAMLEEVLGHYGKVFEVWFDGANGEGPNGKRQIYDWPLFIGTVRRLQPDAVIFSDAGPDVRWVGNERGEGGATSWSLIDRARYVPGTDLSKELTEGFRNAPDWVAPECDVSIRPGWFYHAAEDARVRSVDDLVGLYFSSVGRNGKLLLNVPPTRDGLLHRTDVERLVGMRRALDDVFGAELGAVRSVEWRVHGPSSATLDLNIGASTAVSVIRLEENITRGQRVARYTISGAFGGDELKPIVSGTTIGYTKLERLSPVRRLSRIRLTIEEAVAEPEQIRVRIFST